MGRRWFAYQQRKEVAEKSSSAYSGVSFQRFERVIDSFLNNSGATPSVFPLDLVFFHFI